MTSAVLDEVEAFDRIDVGNALRVPECVGGAERERGGNGAVAQRPAVANPDDRRGHCRHQAERDDAGDDRDELPGERGANEVAEIANERGREDDRERGADGDQEAQS